MTLYCLVENGVVARGPQTDPVGGGNWLPCEELHDGAINHAYQIWQRDRFIVQADKVILVLAAVDNPAVPIDLYKQRRITNIKAIAAEKILAAVPDWKQRNIALGFYDAATSDAMKAAINIIRTYSNGLELSVLSATTLPEVAAVDIVSGWPA